ncbi:MAG: pyridoxamine 5'-phosphate oxidase family protein [Acidobacteriota bacterium]|nr:MAG: pyridoxamine 5'-phosphate oxidase family protein [Acidobacteriota bacterium]
MSGLWEKPVSHGEILKKVWKHLDLGVLESKHPFHTPVFGTVCDGRPEMRVVVLRRFWRRPPGLAFHAHAGSPKLDQIRANPSATWVFYHPEENFQARIHGIAEIHLDDDLADEQWFATSLFARRCYIGKAPSEESKKPTHGLPEAIVDREPTAEESKAGRKNFAVISTKILKVDVMELDVKGHRRSLFDWTSGELETRWLTP